MRIMNSRPWYVDYLFIFMGTGIMDSLKNLPFIIIDTS